MTRSFYLRVDRHKLDRFTRQHILIWLSDKSQIDIWLRSFLASNRIRYVANKMIWEIIPKKKRRQDA